MGATLGPLARACVCVDAGRASIVGGSQTLGHLNKER